MLTIILSAKQFRIKQLKIENLRELNHFLTNESNTFFGHYKAITKLLCISFLNVRIYINFSEFNDIYIIAILHIQLMITSDPSDTFISL